MEHKKKYPKASFRLLIFFCSHSQELTLWGFKFLCQWRFRSYSTFWHIVVKWWCHYTMSQPIWPETHADISSKIHLVIVQTSQSTDANHEN